jgi:glutathione synthase/RimK-type ligase-like ATP-grasp enzyme
VDANGEGVVLLIGSGWRPYREYLLQGLARQSSLWLIDQQPPTWQHSYIVGSSVVGLLDEERAVPDRQGLIDAALGVAKEHRVVGVVTYDELLVTAAAHVGERLGVRGLSVEGAENCRDKSRTRAALTAAGLPQPRFAVVHSYAEAAEAAARIGYPVVAKPRGMGASVGVVRVERPGDLADAFDVVERARHAGPPGYEDGVLIEELVEGPEISIDGAVVDGEYRPFCLARKHLGPPPYFEEVGHVVDAADPLLADPALQQILVEAHHTLGIRDGVTHTEVRLTARGLVVIEVNARLGGDLIPYLGQLATGVDPGRVAAAVATGAAPDLAPTTRTCAGIRFLYPPRDCKVLGVSTPDPSAIAGLVEARPIVQAGTVVRLPPAAHLGRYAYVLAAAPTSSDCALALNAATELVDLRYEPLEATEPLAGRPW